MTNLSSGKHRKGIRTKAHFILSASFLSNSYEDALLTSRGCGPFTENHLWEVSFDILFSYRDLGGSEGEPPSWSCQSEKGTDIESLLLWPQVTELHTHAALWKGITATSSVLGSQWHPCEGPFEEEPEGTFMRALIVFRVPGLAWPCEWWPGETLCTRRAAQARAPSPRENTFPMASLYTPCCPSPFKYFYSKETFKQKQNPQTTSPNRAPFEVWTDTPT